MFPDPDDAEVTVYNGDYDADYSDVDPGVAAQEYQKSRPWFRAAVAAGALVAAASIGVGLASISGGHHAPSASAEAFPSDSPSDIATDTASPSDSASVSASASPSPSPTTASPSPSPSETLQATSTPSPTHSRRVVLPPKPSHSTTPSTAPTENFGSCTLNPNAPSPDFAHRQIICDAAVPAYKTTSGGEVAFTINGPAEIDCLVGKNNFVEASISNATGFVPLDDLSTAVCN
ncbi:MAG: hypothetical protein ACQR33_02480 [Candidatus Saccharibacteria bacterium]